MFLIGPTEDAVATRANERGGNKKYDAENDLALQKLDDSDEGDHYGDDPQNE